MDGSRENVPFSLDASGKGPIYDLISFEKIYYDLGLEIGV